MKHKYSISIVLPCFNEAKSIQKNVDNIYRYLKDRFNSFEIITVNDGSRDNTLSELKRIKTENTIPIRIISNKTNHGKGSAVTNGILKSKNEVVVFMDADLAVPIDELEQFLPEIDKGNDIVIASRFISEIKILKPVLWYRSIMEKIFRILRMIIINNFDIQDTQCGFKVFTREAAFKIFPLLTVKRFSFDVEVIFLAKKMGYRIKELPIILQNPQASHIRIFSDSWNMFCDLIRIRLNEIGGKYKIEDTRNKKQDTNKNQETSSN